MHGFVEFFAYSRGYGISMALMMGAFFFGLMYFRENRLKHLGYSLVFFCFAIAGNLSLMNVALIFCLLIGLHQLIIFKQSKIKLKIIAILMLFFVCLLPLVMLSFKLKALNLLYYGEGNSFAEITLSSFSRMFFGSLNSDLNFIWIVWFSLILMLFFAILWKIKGKLTHNYSHLLFPMLFLMSVGAVFAMKWMLNINYPSDRTGMYLILLMALSMIFVLDRLDVRLHYIASVFSLVFMVHFVFHLNLGYATLWKDEGISKVFWNKVHEQTIDWKGIKNPTIGGYHMQCLQWAWYNYTERDKLQNLQYEDYYQNNEDFMMYVRGDYELNRSQYDSVYTDSWSNITLAKRKQSLMTLPFYEHQNISSKSDCKDEFFGFFETGRADTLVGKTYLIEAGFNLQTLRQCPRLHFVCSLSDSAGNTLLYKYSPLEWLQSSYQSDSDTTNIKIWISKVPKETKSMVVYLWNVNKIGYRLRNGWIRIGVSEGK